MTEIALSTKEAKPTGLTLPASLSYDDWRLRGQQLKVMTGALQWWWGDLLNFGEKKYGEKYTEAVEDWGLKHGTARNMAAISREFEMSLRNDKLTWNHHVAIAGLPQKEQVKLLNKAEKENLSSRDLRELVRQKWLSDNGATSITWEVHEAILRLRSHVESCLEHWPRDQVEIMCHQLRDLADEIPQMLEVMDRDG